MRYDLNPGTRVNTTRTGAINVHGSREHRRTAGHLPVPDQVLTLTNDGSSQFDGVNMMLEKRFSDRWAARVSYTLGYARGNAEANQLFDNNYQVLDDPRLDATSDRSMPTGCRTSC